MQKKEAWVFHPLAKAGELDRHFNRYFGRRKQLFGKLLTLLGKASEDQCEIVFTLFAVWNDMFIQHEQVSDSEIIKRFYQ